MKVEIKKIVLSSIDRFNVEKYPESGFYNVEVIDIKNENIIAFVSKKYRSVNYITLPDIFYEEIEPIKESGVSENKKSETEPKKTEITEAFTLELVRLLTREKDAKN